MEKDEIKYHYFVIGPGGWGRAEKFLEALDNCRKQLGVEQRLAEIKKQRLLAYKFPEDCSIEFDLGYVRFLQGESKEPVDMKLVTRIEM